jgi:hypothetical protein
MSRQPIQSWLTDTGHLQNLISKALYLEELTLLVRTHLAAELSCHVQVANFQAGKLKLTVDSSVWASRLRFCLPHLRNKLPTHAAFNSIISIDYSVQTPPRSLAKSRPARPLISAHNAELLQDTAMAISHTKLQQSLLRLAKRLKT